MTILSRLASLQTTVLLLCPPTVLQFGPPVNCKKIQGTSTRTAVQLCGTYRMNFFCTPCYLTNDPILVVSTERASTGIQLMSTALTTTKRTCRSVSWPKLLRTEAEEAGVFLVSLITPPKSDNNKKRPTGRERARAIGVQGRVAEAETSRRSKT